MSIKLCAIYCNMVVELNQIILVYLFKLFTSGIILPTVHNFHKVNELKILRRKHNTVNAYEV